MKRIFIDTGAFLAKEIEKDQHHVEAVAGWDRLSNRPGALYTSEHCVDETATLLGRRTNHSFAAEWGVDLLASGITILQATPDDWAIAFRFMRKFADQGVSFTDCVSFALMKRHRIHLAFCFDHHFSTAGFSTWQRT